MSIVNIEIDGQKLQVPQGSMVIEAADNAGIAIPRFCYHKKLSIAANCRMCLVQVEKAPKPLPACATPVSEGMKVLTRSAYAKEAQKAVMEFLLINHPLDCPICDQGGQCELQDVALEYGQDYSKFEEGKRSVKDKNIGPLIQTEMTRCIHCTRCVRFGDEIAGLREMGATGRGEHTEIGTYIEHSVSSELSGNVIELCPVGALTSKPFRFKARAWEINSKAGIGMHDPLGSNLFYHTYQSKVVRAVSRENEALNEVWLSDKDRFGVEGLYVQRLMQPEMKQNGTWKQVSWEEALQYAVERIQTLLHDGTPSQLGALASSACSTEELYLLQKLMRDLGSKNVDHRLSMQDASPLKRMDAYPSLHQSLEAFEQNEVIALIGCHPRREIPLLNQRILKAVKQGAQVLSLQSYSDENRYPIVKEVLVQQGDFAPHLLGVVKLLLENHKLDFDLPKDMLDKINQAKVQPDHQAFAEKLSKSTSKVILMGHDILAHPEAALLQYIIRLIAHLVNAQVAEITENANGAGAWAVGMVPYEPLGDNRGLSAIEMLSSPLKAMFLMNLEPEFDCADPKRSIETLKEVDEVICLTPFVTQTMRSYATLLLPMAPMSETEGTYLNVLGQSQTVRAATPVHYQSKPAWKILRVLGNLLHLEGYQYNTAQEVLKEAQTMERKGLEPKAFFQQSLQTETHAKGELMRLAPFAMYASNNVLRRAHALQETVEAKLNEKAILHPGTAEKFGFMPGALVQVEEDTQEERFEVAFDDKIPEGCVLIHRGIQKTMQMNGPFKAVHLKAVDKG